MANLGASDIAVSIKSVKLMGRQRRVHVTFTFGDGAKLYPVGGIPLPAGSVLGFYRQIELVALADLALPIGGTEWLWASDAGVTNTFAQPGVLKAFMFALPGGAAFAANTGVGLLADSDGTTLTKTSAGAKSNIAAYVECTNTLAPAATVIRAEVVGW